MMSEGNEEVETVAEDLNALGSDSQVDKVSPVNWDEVPKMDLNGQIPNKNGPEIETHIEVGRPIVVYDDPDNEEEIQNGSENGVAIENLPNVNENNDVQGDGERGEDDRSASDKEGHQSSRRSSLSLREISDARSEAENEPAEGNICCDVHNVPVSTNGEEGQFEDTVKPIPTVELKTETINGVEVEGEVVCCERHDTPINDVAEDECQMHSGAEAEETVEEAYSGGISGDTIQSEPDLEFKLEASNGIEVDESSAKIEKQLDSPEENGDTEKLEFMSVKLRTRTWEQDNNYNNVDVLKSIADEVDGDEGDQARVKKLISWAKSSKKTKTETMKVREKKKIDSMRQAVDPNSLSMVIEEKGAGAAPSKGNKFEVRRVDSGASFQVRKYSAILPQSETVVTKEWIQSAVKLHEQEADVMVTDMSFKKANDMYHASISAKVAGKEKAYNWVIRVNPTDVDWDGNAKDKETFMVSELGKKIAEFVTRLKTAQGKMSVSLISHCISGFSLVHCISSTISPSPWFFRTFIQYVSSASGSVQAGDLRGF